MALSQKEEMLRGTNVEMSKSVKTLGLAANGADTEEWVWVDGRAAADDFGSDLDGISITFNAAVTAAGTDFFTLSVIQYDSTGSAKATVASFTTATMAATKGVPVALNIGTHTAIAKGDTLSYKIHQTGAGKVCPTGLLTFETNRLSDEE